MGWAKTQRAQLELCAEYDFGGLEMWLRKWGSN